MVRLRQVDIQARDPAQLEALVGAERTARFEANAAAARAFLAGRRVLNVNSTAVGGGVAELLQTLLAYARAVGVDAQWVVIEGTPDFFEITKRIHNLLYGSPGDGGPLDARERAIYEATLSDNAADLRALVQPDDIVLLHDPQTAALAPTVRASGATVVWRCHVGIDSPNEYSELAWTFLRPYIDDVDAYVFTCPQFAPGWVDRRRLAVIPPSIDPFSAKNADLDRATVEAVLGYAGFGLGSPDPAPVAYTRRDGSPGRLARRVDILQTGPPPPSGAPVVLQASRWDRAKDMLGVLHAFVDHVDWSTDPHLVLAGPAVHGVADDPEAAELLEECTRAWHALPETARGRVHLACVPMHDPDEAALIVNALQRHADVVTQKSIAEGFGLTVTEAMWKSRPVVATRVGGIVDQIVDGESGLLVDDPLDLEAFGHAVTGLLSDRALAERVGQAAHTRVFDEFLGDTHLERYARLFEAIGGARTS
jgi:trehalose synthase